MKPTRPSPGRKHIQGPADNVVTMRRKAKTISRGARLIDADLVIGGGLNAKLFELLAAIDRVGSINQAAGQAGLSYKGAWEMIERATSLSPRPLIDRNAGGGEVKGTRLTETGKSLLTAFLKLQNEKELFLDKLNQELAQDPLILQWFKCLFMKSSARNQWAGKVSRIHIGAVTAEITVSLTRGATLVARITHESANSLNLFSGRDVIALVKAPEVMVVTGMEGYRLSAHNQLAGTITDLRPETVNSEVTISLSSGDTVVATITAESAESMGLHVGTPATAVFKASSVILSTAV